MVRSLKASSAGIEKALDARTDKAWTYEKVAEQVGCSRQPINKFFTAKPVKRELFVKICQTLELNWQEIAEPELTPVESQQDSPTELNDIETVVQQVRCACHARIQYQCGSLRMLDISRPIALTDIFTEVNVLEQINSQQWRDISELVKGFNPEYKNFDRLGLGRVRQARVSGLDAVSRYQKLMVLGKPGSGKTTFLQHIAIQCNQGKFESQRVPIFIKLKEFVEDAQDQGKFNLFNYLIQNLSHSGISFPIANKLIEEGKTLILLDGLDEVTEEYSKRVVQEICKLTQYYQNYFVITCRIAASSHQFQEFTDVEVADFNLDQVQSFAQKWFVAVAENTSSEGKALAYQFINQLLQPKNQAIRELAVTPILLNLTCLVFKEIAHFPSNRARLYEQGLDILLRRWDAARGIHRDEVYDSLTLARKKQLLSHLAAITFERGDYFFEQSQIKKIIADYLGALPDAKPVPEEDSKAVLKSIEAQHGLLVERARGIYSFSHLTFQEYFTAQKIVNNSTPETMNRLVSHLNEKRWREVFLLAGEMLNKTDDLLQLIKQHIDLMVASDENLQQLLCCVNQKSRSITTTCKSAATRIFYYSRIRAYIYDLPRADSSDFAHFLDANFKLSFDLLLDREIDRLLAFTFNRTLDLRRALCRLIMMVLAYPINQRPSIDYILGFTFTSLHQKELVTVCKLWHSLQLLSSQLPNSKNDPENFKQWWYINGQTWREQLRKVMIDHRNIGHTWQLNEHQKELLEQYFQANLFLLDCLHRTYNVTPAVREEIEETLLLPIAEIEQRASG